jgi:O-antigen/teichoic acid export membrane protein
LNLVNKDSESSIVSSFTGGTLLMGLATAVSMVLGLINTAIIVRHTSPADYGEFVLLQVAYVFLAELSSFGLTLAIPKFIASEDYELRKSDLIKTAIYFRMVTIIVLVTLCLFAKPVLVKLSASNIIVNLFYYTLLLFILESLGTSSVSILQGLFRFNTIAKIKLLDSGSYLILTLIFLVYIDQGIEGVVRARIISLILSYSYAYLTLPLKRGSVINLETLKNMLVFGFPLQLQYFLGFIYNRIDTVIVGVLLGTVGVAYYEVARKIPQSISRLYGAFREVYLPFVANLDSRGEFKKLLNLLNNSIRWLSFLTMFGALIALLFSREIVVILFSDSYLASIPAFILLMIGLNLTFVESTFGYSLVAIGDSDKPLIVNIVRVAISLLCNLFLIPAFSFIGAAVASLIGNLVSIPLDLFFLHRRNIAAQARYLTKPIIVFSLCAIIFLYLENSFVIIRLAFVCLYFAISVLISVITIQDLTNIFREINIILVSVIHKPRLRRSK